MPLTPPPRPLSTWLEQCPPVLQQAWAQTERLHELYEAIKTGADSFLMAEYKMCAIFVAVSAPLIGVLVARGSEGGGGISANQSGIFSAVSFTVGALTSMLSGWIGMRVAVFSNARCTVGAIESAPSGWTMSFNTAFRAGGVMGFSLCGLALLVMYGLIGVYAQWFDYGSRGSATRLMDAIAGFGLGGSAIAMFGRVGGGIYTKAADVGADLAGKVVEDLPEDDPHNPGTIADNVGDNVGDVAGMGADLFGSFGEATCAALLVGASSDQIIAAGWPGKRIARAEHSPRPSSRLPLTHSVLTSPCPAALMFPLTISGAGIIVCMLTSFVATHLRTVKSESDIEQALKLQLLISTLLMTPTLYQLCHSFLPAAFYVSGVCSSPLKAFFCVGSGLWGGCLIGFVTEYYTSFSYRPVQEVSEACRTGAATNIIYGLALGCASSPIRTPSHSPITLPYSRLARAALPHPYSPPRRYQHLSLEHHPHPHPHAFDPSSFLACTVPVSLRRSPCTDKSVIVPVATLAAIVWGAHTLAGFYGIALAALGMLSTLATCLTIDVYGPVCDNAGGIAEMCELHPSVREKTDALDAAGNTTAAIGKGFAIGSATLVGLALFGAFVTRLNATTGKKATVDLLEPLTFAGLLLGSMLPCATLPTTRRPPSRSCPSISMLSPPRSCSFPRSSASTIPTSRPAPTLPLAPRVLPSPCERLHLGSRVRGPPQLALLEARSHQPSLSLDPPRARSNAQIGSRR